jgi:hypothetical protein
VAATYTPGSGTSTDRVRMIVPDRDTDNAVFQDEEIADLLVTEGGNVKRAAALALETIATDEALVQKVIRTGDVQTDGSKTAMALLARAARLRAQADDDDEALEGGAFDVAEQVVDHFSARERLRKQALRLRI